ARAIGSDRSCISLAPVGEPSEVRRQLTIRTGEVGGEAGDRARPMLLDQPEKLTPSELARQRCLLRCGRVPEVTPLAGPCQVALRVEAARDGQDGRVRELARRRAIQGLEHLAHGRGTSTPETVHDPPLERTEALALHGLF